MIEARNPDTWVDLQNEVSKIFIECGLDSETPKTIETVRGVVEVDVYAVDNSLSPSLVYLCECKHWKSAVPQTIIHSFRTVVSDFGANWGIIISLNGYQSGAYEAIKNTNLKILNWGEFQNIFEERWYKEYFKKQLKCVAEPLIDYTEPINTRILKKADLLTPSAKEEFKKLRIKYANIAFFTLSLYSNINSKEMIKLPIEHPEESENQNYLPLEIYKAQSYRELLKILFYYINKGLEEFDVVFGCRI